MKRIKELNDSFYYSKNTMKKTYGYNYFLKKRQKTNWLKRISIISSVLMILQMSLGNLFFIALPLSSTQATSGNLCSSVVDAVMVMDRSGSMEDAKSSVCKWENLEKVNGTHMCVPGQALGLTLAECQAKDVTPPPQCPFNYQYTPAVSSKISAAKQAANDFLNNLGTGDQSALVSFSDTATLDKQFSNNHSATQSAVSGLTANGATDIGDAIGSGIQELKSVRANSQAVKVMILLTDGKANKPTGNGNDENSTDVAYAESKALEAAGLGYKIFTIGLGSNGDINETMLNNIANVTGADYFHSPTADQLQDIYKDITTRICKLGSISGCKYSSSNPNQISQITGLSTIAGWPIVLKNKAADLTLTQTTDDSGCYKFSGLNPDDYIVSEGEKQGVSSVQTFPASVTYDQTLVAEQDILHLDFANYLAVCGNGTKDRGESCDDSNVTSGDGCSSQCLVESANPVCGDGQVNQTAEQCDGNIQTCLTTAGYSGSKTCSSTCLWENCSSNEFCGDNIKNGTEACDGVAGVVTGFSCTNNCTLQQNGGSNPVCGNGIKETGETCDDGQSNGFFGFCNTVCGGQTAGSIISGFKFDDPDGLASTTAGRIGLFGWEIQLFGSSSTSTLIASTSTDTSGFYQFSNLAPDTYGLSEVMKNGWVQIEAPTSSIAVLILKNSTNNNFVNYFKENESSPTFCGDGIRQLPNSVLLSGPANDGFEECDGVNGVGPGFICLSSCILEPIGSSGGGGGVSRDVGQGSAGLIDLATGKAIPPPEGTPNPEEPTVLGEIGEPKLAIIKSIEMEFANPGTKNIEYRVKISNTGNLSAFQVELDDVLPKGLVFSGTNATTKHWDVGDLAVGKSKEIIYSVDVKADAKPMEYINTATAKALNHDAVIARAKLAVEPIKVLAATGFNNTEFTFLLSLLMFFITGSAFLKRRLVLLNNTSIV